MNNTGLINCPNCNKRTFGDKKQCIYCKYVLKNEHNFNSDIYDFLQSDYNVNKNKPETIKTAMKKFGLSMKEAKEIVDHISEQMYYNENALKSAEKIKKEDIPREQLPTNGIDYSKYKIYGTRAYKKALFIKIIIPCFFLVLILILLSESIISMELGIVSFAFGIILLIKARTRTTVDINPHTFVFSFSRCFIHYILPNTILVIFAMLVFVLLFKSFFKLEQIFLILGIASFVWFCIVLLNCIRKSTGEFTADYGNIKYTRFIAGNYQKGINQDYYWHTNEIYIIKSIKEIKETMNSIIIYGDIMRNYYKRSGLSWSKMTDYENINYLKVTKTFKNNKNLVKSLQILSIEYK